MTYIYLHGFASSPRSAKAEYLRDRFVRMRGTSLNVLDLNQGNFSHLTLTRQLKQAAAAFPPPPTPVRIIGSSFGGLTAAWLGQLYPQVESLVLLAPAFGFLDHWLPRLGEEEVRKWRETGYLEVYHYGEGRSLPLHYGFIEDVESYQEEELQRRVPTLILHGMDDEVIPIQASRNYAQQRPWVELRELASDHSLGKVKEEIWQAVQEFFAL